MSSQCPCMKQSSMPSRNTHYSKLCVSSWNYSACWFPVWLSPALWGSYFAYADEYSTKDSRGPFYRSPSSMDFCVVPSAPVFYPTNSRCFGFSKLSWALSGVPYSTAIHKVPTGSVLGHLQCSCHIFQGLPSCTDRFPMSESSCFIYFNPVFQFIIGEQFSRRLILHRKMYHFYSIPLCVIF